MLPPSVSEQTTHPSSELRHVRDALVKLDELETILDEIGGCANVHGYLMSMRYNLHKHLGLIEQGALSAWNEATTQEVML